MRFSTGTRGHSQDIATANSERNALAQNEMGDKEMTEARTLRAETRMDAREIELLDQKNALLELEDIISRVRTMAAVSYDLEIEEVWEFLDIWAAGGNPEARELLAALQAAVVRAGRGSQRVKPGDQWIK